MDQRFYQLSLLIKQSGEVVSIDTVIDTLLQVSKGFNCKRSCPILFYFISYTVSGSSSRMLGRDKGEGLGGIVLERTVSLRTRI